MANPYRDAIRLGETKLPGQSGALFDNKGELNASSKKDAAQQIGRMITVAQSQGAMGFMNPAERAELKANRERVLTEALASPEKTRMLGEALTADILETTNREGFARRVMEYRELGQGQINEIVFKYKQVRAWDAVSATEVTPTELRDRRILPTEIHLNAYMLIDTREQSRASSDLLEEKYEEGLEQIMVVEDRLWRAQAVGASTARNTITTFSTWTPRVFSEMLWQVQRWGVPAAQCMFDASLWQDFVAGNEFAQAYDPVTKWEILQTGFLGNMYGVNLLSDTFRQEKLKVLQTGEVFIVGAPGYHGVMTVRGAVTTEPINLFNVGVAKRGWFIDQITSVNIMNSYSVARGQRM